MGGRLDGWMMDGWKDGWTNVSMDGRKADERKGGEMDGWMDGWMEDVGTDGRTDGWMDI
jgi:hypothetical protein